MKAVSLQHGYGFVQYEEISSALKALKELHGRKFFGMNLGTHAQTTIIMQLHNCCLSVVVDKPLMWKKLDGGNCQYTTITTPNLYFYTDEPITTKYTGGDRGRSRPYRDRPKPRMREEHSDWDGPPARFRDPEYERYLEMRYMEEMLAERQQSDRYYAPRHFRPTPPDYGSEWHDSPYMPGPSRSSYARPRDDPYDQMPFERERRHYGRYGY